VAAPEPVNADPVKPEALKPEAAKPVPEKKVAPEKKPVEKKLPPEKPVAAAPAPLAPPPPPVVPQAKPQVEAPRPVAAHKSLDEQYNERVEAECSAGFTGILCREKVRFALCSDKWSETPPPGQSTCKQSANKQKGN
jgi:hypothetical protein